MVQQGKAVGMGQPLQDLHLPLGFCQLITRGGHYLNAGHRANKPIAVTMQWKNVMWCKQSGGNDGET